MIDKSLRYKYAWGGPGGKSPSGPGRSGPPGGGDRQMSYSAPPPTADRHPDPPPVTTAKAPPSILSRPTLGPPKNIHEGEQIIKKVINPFEETRDAGLITLRPPNIHEGENIIKKVINPFEETRDAGNLVDLTDLRDDAKTQQVQLIQKKADDDWANKSTYEKEEQQEKWDIAEEKLKSTKEGGFWKSLGNIALAMLVPALLPAKIASAYKAVKGASWVANKLGLTETDIVQLAQKKTGKKISTLIAEGKGLQSGAELLGLKKRDDRSGIEGQLAFKPGSSKDKRLRTLHNQKTEGLFWNEQNQKEYKQLLKEDAEQTEYPKSVTVAHGGRIDKPFPGRSRDI
tara:strand:+ start:273 stop:1301 length:1029 start_codon:yes stop_codon:yes gene_type:complete